jgi:predicted acylesterase/phospholipase RssA
LIRPNVTVFRTMEFYQASAIIRSAEAAKAEFKERLATLLNAAP